MRLFVLGAALIISMSTLAPAAYAKSSSPIGKWKGGGVLQPNNGHRERTRCRATVRKAPARGAYDATINCATSAGRITQRTRLRRIGANRYRGRFTIPKYNTRGTVTSVVRGNTQSVTVRSNKGRGWLKLHR